MTEAPGSRTVTVPGGGTVALRPAWSSTVVIAASGSIDDKAKAGMLAVLAQDGLGVVFVENATAIADLPPDPVLRDLLNGLASEWEESAGEYDRDIESARNSEYTSAHEQARIDGHLAAMLREHAAAIREAIK